MIGELIISSVFLDPDIRSDSNFVNSQFHNQNYQFTKWIVHFFFGRFSQKWILERGSRRHSLMCHFGIMHTVFAKSIISLRNDQVWWWMGVGSCDDWEKCVSFNFTVKEIKYYFRISARLGCWYNWESGGWCGCGGISCCSWLCIRLLG